VNWSNPYEDRRGRWYKGTLHVHTSPASHCGKVELPRVLELYAEAGFDFLAVSDHMAVTPAEHPNMAFIPSIEWNAAGGGQHVGILTLDPAVLEEAIGIAEQDALLAFLAEKDALVILNHPNWQSTPHYRREELAATDAYDGIEVYNNVIERLVGDALATDKWDYLLTTGRKVLGIAGDDSHMEKDIGRAAVVVRSPNGEASDLLGSLRKGNFYCTSGVTIRDIRKEGPRIIIESDDAQEIQAIAQGGRLIERRFEPTMNFELSEACSLYVRFTLYGQGSSMAWTQPFFTA